jgi:Protein of unknown function (DUF3631)
MPTQNERVSSHPHLTEARPVLPDELDDRAQDVWEPLFAIADRAGGDWPERARRAAIALSGNGARAEESAGIQLLADIRGILDLREADRISSATLAEALHEIEESPWSEWYGRPITARGIARLLARYEIRPKSVRLDDETTAKGYKRDQFEDAWTRYLPSESGTTAQPAPLEGLRPFSIRHEPHRVTKNARIPHGQTYVPLCRIEAPETGTRLIRSSPGSLPRFTPVTSRPAKALELERIHRLISEHGERGRGATHN